jgi:hypothetical protein
LIYIETFFFWAVNRLGLACVVYDWPHAWFGLANFPDVGIAKIEKRT